MWPFSNLSTDWLFKNSHLVKALMFKIRNCVEFVRYWFCFQFLTHDKSLNGVRRSMKVGWLIFDNQPKKLSFNIHSIWNVVKELWKTHRKCLPVLEDSFIKLGKKLIRIRESAFSSFLFWFENRGCVDVIKMLRYRPEYYNAAKCHSLKIHKIFQSRNFPTLLIFE